MRIPVRNYLFICFCLLLLSSCDGFNKIKKSSDVNMKLTKANEYFDQKKYGHANELYGQLLGIMKNTRNYEPLYYRYAYTFYYEKDYLEASFHFKNFVEFFPNSKDADECEFMHGVSLFRYAPKATLDQTNTVKAMEALQSFINTHPKSKNLKEANGYVEICLQKLEEKDVNAAKLYYNISQYKAAGVAFRNVMRNYPESPSSDFYQYMIVRSLYKYAKASVVEKQEERYANAISAYKDLQETYPKSKYLADATKINLEASNNVKKIRNEQHK